MANQNSIGGAGHYHCRCCGGALWTHDGHPIHTGCIVKHWDRHAKGINISKCHEFSKARQS